MMCALRTGSRAGLAPLARLALAARGSMAPMALRRRGSGGGGSDADGSQCCPPPDFFPLPKPVQVVLNEQIGAELAASLAYIDMAARMSTVAVSLRGAAAMFHANAAEEWGHAQALVYWLVSRGGFYAPRAVPAPSGPPGPPGTSSDTAWDEAHGAIATATAQERQVTESLLHLHSVASSCGDIATADFVSHKMLRDQVQALYVLGQAGTQLQRIKDSPQGLHYWDEMLYQKFANQDH